MNGDRPLVNGQHILNGATSAQHHQATEAKISRSSAPPNGPPNGPPTKSEPAEPYMNGIHTHDSAPSKPRPMINGLKQAPQEILDIVSRENYLPIASLINRRTQTTWARLSTLIQELATFDVPLQHVPPGAPIKNQTRPNLDKKDAVLGFLKLEKEDFIKLLVLVEWGKKADQVAKIISISQWLAQRRHQYWVATSSLAALKQDAIGFQIPNPDITTAGEVLSTGKVSSFPDIGYHETRPLSKKQILAVLKRLNRILSLRLSLLEDLPPSLKDFNIHDGRVTFRVPQEFEVDLSVLDEAKDSPFRVVDFRFAFRPRPAVPDYLRAEIERLANEQIDSNGLLGCYQFLHELTISNKLIELHKQALDLARSQWGGQLRIELLRRNLVVQYWLERKTTKSWLDIGINKGEQGDPSYLAVRWFRESKEVVDFQIDVDLANLSLESLLAQIIAQHSSWILDSCYDRLIEVSLFQTGDLLTEQSTSDFNPDECSLRIQVNKLQDVVASLDSVTGSLRISPASDRTSRLEAELNRSKNLAQEFVPKFLNYRCVVTEGMVADAISDTSWQRLSAFRPSSADVRTILSPRIIRINFFRHPTWSRDYLCAIAHSPDGDEMILLQLALHGTSTSFSGSQIVHREFLDFSHNFDSESFERLAGYASRLIVVHATARSLRVRAWKCRFPPKKGFEEHLPSHLLSFDIGSASQETKNDAGRFETVQLDFGRLDIHSKVAKISATVQTEAEKSVLERLSESNPDQRIVFDPTARQIRFEISSAVGEPAIDEIVSQVTRVHDLTACIQTIQSLSTTRLTFISMSAMTVGYELADSKDLSMHVQFPAADTPARVEFSPADSNPHIPIAASLSRILNDKTRTCASRLTDTVSLLTLTAPLLSALRDIEHSLQSPAGEIPNLQSSGIQAHVLVRQPTMFALQFFQAARNQGAPSSPQSRMLARLEILPQTHEKNSWLVRPAMEEFNQYSKASYASPGLQKMIRSEVFAKMSPNWIRLDTAAACLVHKPQPLLNALKQVIIDWVEKEEQARPPQVGTVAQAPIQQPLVKPQQQAAGPPNNSNAGNKPAPKQGQVKPVQGQLNGVVQQPQGRPRPGGSARPTQAAPKSKDVIEID